ncbi:MAG: Adenine DNA glycosylase [Chlamydiae bacterium]|nr:Adenine DNA glycosylase [Chlamydiota bacterium]
MEQEKLAEWFQKNKRDFPWRKDLSPYHVWVSEVMLQQTLAQVVIPYFERWMQLFPTVEDLAKASLETVIKAWEGLGYYSRARNLHAGAQQIVAEFDGKIPDNENELKKIKGIGDYTAGAILSFVFHKKAPAVDGNVIRVASRLMAIDDDISQPKTVKKIRENVEDMLPEEEPWIVMEALIELGAMICRKKPLCDECPLRQQCQAYLQGCEQELPFKSQKIRYENLYRTVFIVKCEDHYLLRVPKKGEIMQDLHEFPYVENRLTKSKAGDYLKSEYQIEATYKQKLNIVKHTFTRYRAQLFPFIFETNNMAEVNSLKWVSRSKIGDYAFSSGHRRILSELTSESFRYL